MANFTYCVECEKPICLNCDDYIECQSCGDIICDDCKQAGMVLCSCCELNK